MDEDCLSKRIASYLAFCAFALTFMIGLGAGVSPLSLVGRALTGAAVFWICGIAVGPVVVNGLVETTDSGGANQPGSSSNGPANSAATITADESAVSDAPEQESAAATLEEQSSTI